MELLLIVPQKEATLFEHWHFCFQIPNSSPTVATYSTTAQSTLTVFVTLDTKWRLISVSFRSSELSKLFSGFLGFIESLSDNAKKKLLLEVVLLSLLMKIWLWVLTVLDQN